MKIISDFKDYYDWAVTMGDPMIVYDRQTTKDNFIRQYKNFVNVDCKLTKAYPLMSALAWQLFDNTYIEQYFSIIGFCDKIYLRHGAPEVFADKMPWATRDWDLHQHGLFIDVMSDNAFELLESIQIPNPNYLRDSLRPHYQDPKYDINPKVILSKLKSFIHYVKALDIRELFQEIKAPVFMIVSFYNIQTSLYINPSLKDNGWIYFIPGN